MRLIAISAQKRCGKDTAANYMVDRYGYVKYALARPFKDMIVERFPMITKEMIDGINYDREQIIEGLESKVVFSKFMDILITLGYADVVSEYGKIDWSVVYDVKEWSVRKLMQSIGTDIGCNQVDKLIWMRPMIDLHIELAEQGKGLVISDCRQDHEMDVMREFNALVIHIQNPYVVSKDEHITEKGLPIKEGDPVIINEFNPKYEDNPSYCRIKLIELQDKIDDILYEHGIVQENKSSMESMA